MKHENVPVLDNQLFAELPGEFLCPHGGGLTMIVGPSTYRRIYTTDTGEFRLQSPETPRPHTVDLDLSDYMTSETTLLQLR